MKMILLLVFVLSAKLNEFFPAVIVLAYELKVDMNWAVSFVSGLVRLKKSSGFCDTILGVTILWIQTKGQCIEGSAGVQCVGRLTIYQLHVCQKCKIAFSDCKCLGWRFQKRKIFLDDENKFTCIVQFFKILLNGRVISVVMVRGKSF